MNEAHLHLVINHFPIIGPILGFGILLIGIFLKNNTLKNTAYIIFIVSSLFGIASMSTGEEAEELVEKLPNIGHEIIHEHEEIAEKLALTLNILGLVAIFGLFLNLKNHVRAHIISYIAAVLGIIGIAIATQVGTTGGAIRHIELRK
ncbi:hypothetical protein B0A58_06730 [Flavobacterium branchiophilum NBRC 15030 = ATCC 35035]|uniref:DUF2231 domain-containing protein n=1 Tax=Flavobacterium branchiophilum TaxID=55197 RepID=A0A543G7Y3_9FLAO|nr:hypothetical protein [Flavobacterium branchiophilum]OXA76947.1 hypothetical protein B0A58_06730 [Flavobacterium branchiophilum NBRC 15030 = ATCC 35035]TQM42193.1 hypothetical protein BC670_3229 [Flavobacterium branchiophilum]GEM54512.1 hypothetical protein FB1_07330 [Flavobacterium branchiophilum NBRC 15030 = ATCC 35035]